MKRIITLAAGAALALCMYWINPFQQEGDGQMVLAIAVLMIAWWVTEALPMPVVALLPVLLFPLTGAATIEESVKPYSDKIIFLFMGGFLLGMAIEKWNLHRRIALSIVQVSGTSGNRIIMGFMAATALLSMWLSNTATTMMMFPIALSVIHVMQQRNAAGYANFSLTLMLCIAYASNIGGITTVIGTPPNVAYVGFFESTYGMNIGFAQWMALGIPAALLMLVALFAVMVKWFYPNRIRSSPETALLIREELSKLGRITTNEKRVLLIFSCTALLWITKDLIKQAFPFLPLDDTIIALAGAFALFICPAKDAQNRSLLEWTDTSRMAWGILLLFGGGLSLAAALEREGLMLQLGNWLSQFGGNTFLLVLAVTITSLFLSEVMSNVAQVIVFAPVVSGLAEAMEVHPLLLGLPMTFAASCAFMLPMGTPPNAIVFSSGHIQLSKMLRIGFVMNIVSVIIITLLCMWLIPLLMF